MTITLQIPHELESKIHEKAASGDMNSIRELLLDVFTPEFVEAYLTKQTVSNLSDDEFKRIADQFTEEFASYVGPNFPPLSDYAVSRESIYKDNPKL